MKNWYKQPLTKIILVMIAIVTPAIAAVSLVLVTGVASTLSSDTVFGETKVFEESDFFENLMHSATTEMLYAYNRSEMLETDGKYDPDKLVDVMGYAEGISPYADDSSAEESSSYEISGKNISGLAYTVGELVEWGSKGDIYEYDDRIIVCRKANDTYHYYWLSDFKKMVSDGSLRLETDDSDEREMFLEELEEGYLYDEERNLTLWDGDTKYEDVWTYDGDALKEYYAPNGAKDILEVVNKMPELNGNLMNVYDNIRTSMNRIHAEYENYKDFSTLWTEGNTNFTYLFVNNEKKTIYTNNSVFADYEKVESDLAKFTNNKDIRYIIVRPKLNAFESNLDVKAADWYSPVNGQEILGDDYLALAAVDTSYPIQDIFYEAAKSYHEFDPYIDDAKKALMVSLPLFLVAIIWLTMIAGRKADEGNELYLNFFDHWKTELSAVLTAGLWLLLTMILLDAWGGVGTKNYAYYSQNGLYSSHIYYYGFNMTEEDVLIISVYMVLSAILFLIGYLSLVRRLKGGTLWKDSILKMLLTWAVRVWRFVSEHVQSFWSHRRVLWKMLLVFAAVVLIHWFAVAIYGTPLVCVFLMLLSEAAAAYLLIRDAIAKERIKEGIQEISSGNLDYKLPLNVRQGGLSGYGRES